ncbi:hypothetical protein DCC79_15370, partial [bacterium]
FVARLYSCLDWSRRPRVLTTTSEFHSFARQTRRLEETGRLEVARVPVEPYATFRARFAAALRARHDLVFVSQVFFDSSFVVEGLDELLAGVPAETMVAVDGYHAFMAIPVALGVLGERIFYTAGGYKYAQAGEGACFLSIPADCTLRPAYTGWYSDFGRLSGAQGDAVGYGPAAMRFWGSTFDPSGLYVPVTPEPPATPAVSRVVIVTLAPPTPTPEPPTATAEPTLAPTVEPAPTAFCGPPNAMRLVLDVDGAQADRRSEPQGVSFRSTVRNDSAFPVSLTGLVITAQDSRSGADQFGSDRRQGAVEIAPGQSVSIDGVVKLDKFPSPFGRSELCVSFVAETCGRRSDQRPVTRRCTSISGF